MAKYTCYFKPKIYYNINQQLAKQFILHSAEASSEPFQTSKQGDYLFGGNCFHKKFLLRCLKRFWIRYIVQWTTKTIKPHKAKTPNMKL